MVVDKANNSASKSQLCPCGKANRSVLERVPRGRLVKTVLFWLPVKKYKCYRCTKTGGKLGNINLHTAIYPHC
jgi:hypothetical protein